MRAFAGGFYQNLKALYDHLGVPYRSQPFLFEFAKGSSTKDASYFVHASNLHQLAPRPRVVGTIAYLVEVLYLLVCYGWFSICCLLFAPFQGETLRRYLGRTWIPQYFATYYVVPLLSSVTTCPHDVLLNFPASDLIEYKRRIHRAPHYTVSAGVQAVQDQLIQGIDYELGATVKAVESRDDGVRISWEKNGGGVRTDDFERVILAVAPDIVARIFEPLQYCMNRMPTAIVESVVHMDRSVLEETEVVKKAAAKYGAQHIYLRTSTSGVQQTESHHIQPCGAVVTTCPFNRIDPALVLQSVKFTRVLRSPESQRIVNAIFGADQEHYSDDKVVPQWRSGNGNVWLAGGWCWDGMVLLEGCVVSAARIAEDFGVDVPWR
jgi:predicted NAD/FAD-binding protein